ncbi:MAG: hypothetical protein AB1412_05360 [Pseudomonadota bacterium]
MRLRCPVCHAESALEAWAQDDAAREMMALLANLPAELGRPLAAYLGLWRSPSRALAWDRAHRLAQETMALSADGPRLAAALAQTVEQLRAKREAGDTRPLGNHNYLRRVIEGTPGGADVLPSQTPAVAHRAPRSKTLDAIAAASRIRFTGED